MVPRARTASTLIVSAFAVCAAPLVPRAQAAAPDVNSLLSAGQVADAESLLAAHLTSNAGDDNARFALGVTQVLAGGERVMQSLYRYGLDPRWRTMLPFVRLPVPVNPHSEALTNAAFREIVLQLVADLRRADATLAAIQSSEVKLPLTPGTYRLDFNGDGQAGDDEKLWKIFERVTGRQLSEVAAADFEIAFDVADVHWLRGYCHLLCAMCESFLAYDTSMLHDYSAQLFFPLAVTKSRRFGEEENRDRMWTTIAEGITFIHMLRLPVADGKRMKTARADMLTVIDQSREAWAAIAAEWDDDREWIPSPKQHNAAIPGVAVSAEMVAAWHELLSEFEAVLNGEKLVPFWRGDAKQGVNLKRVFEEPTEFDLVLWVQGSAALPYLEDGPQTKPEFWDRLRREFRGQFFWFAIWVN